MAEVAISIPQIINTTANSIAFILLCPNIIKWDRGWQNPFTLYHLQMYQGQLRIIPITTKGPSPSPSPSPSPGPQIVRSTQEIKI